MISLYSLLKSHPLVVSLHRSEGCCRTCLA